MIENNFDVFKTTADDLINSPYSVIESLFRIRYPSIPVLPFLSTAGSDSIISDFCMDVSTLDPSFSLSHHTDSFQNEEMDELSTGVNVTKNDLENLSENVYFESVIKKNDAYSRIPLIDKKSNTKQLKNNTLVKYIGLVSDISPSNEFYTAFYILKESNQSRCNYLR
jgi:hypothetical protein